VNPLWLRFLPYKWFAVGAAALVLLGIISFDKIKIAGLRTDIATEKAAFSDFRREGAVAARADEIKQRNEEARRVAAQRKADDEREQQLVLARADAATADAAAGRLRARYAAFVAASREARGDPAAAPSSTPEPAADLSADVLGGVLEIARQYVAAAEDAITRGELAERKYDALIVPAVTLSPMRLGQP